MKTRVVQLTIIGAALLLLGAMGPITIQAEPMFLLSKSRINVQPGTIPDQIEIAWESEIFGEGYSSPVYYDGKIYVGSSDDNMYCFNAETGELIWSYDSLQTGTSAGFGLCSTPCIYDEKVYFGSADFFALCLDAGNGDVIWKHYLPDPGSGTSGYGACASPIVDNGKVYIGTDSTGRNMHCLDAVGNGDGTTNQIWAYRSPGEGFVFSSPTITGDNLLIGFYTGRTIGEFICLDKNGDGNDNTTMTWRYSTADPTFTTPVVTGGTVYVSTGDYRDKNRGIHTSYAIPLDSTGDMAPLSEDWHFTTGNPILSSVVPYQGKFIIVDQSGLIHCLNGDGGLDKGTTADWTYSLNDEVWGTPTIVGDRLLLGNFAGDLYCLDVSDISTEPTEVWKIDLGDGDIYSTAAFNNGKIYITTNDGKLYCLAKATPKPPQVTSTTPPSSDIDVSIDTTITVEFDMEMDESTTSSAFVTDPFISGTTSVVGSALTFTPDSTLEYASSYTITISYTAEAMNGMTLDGNQDGKADGGPEEDYSFSFTTEPKPPENKAPTLSSGKVTPTTGNDLVEYRFTVTYTDPDGDSPYYVKLILDGEENLMSKDMEASSSALKDGDMTNGEAYYFETYLMEGEHTYNFKASDSKEAAETTELKVLVTASGDDDIVDDDITDDDVDDDDTTDDDTTDDDTTDDDTTDDDTTDDDTTDDDTTDDDTTDDDTTDDDTTDDDDDDDSNDIVSHFTSNPIILVGALGAIGLLVLFIVIMMRKKNIENGDEYDENDDVEVVEAAVVEDDQ